MDNYVINEQEKEEQERKKRELQAELLCNDKIIVRKTDELVEILNSKVEHNTIASRTFTDISEKAEAIVDKLYKSLELYREAEKYYPELKAANDKCEKTIHELESVVKELRENTAVYQNEADKLIAERKAELAQRLDKATSVPAYHQQREQPEKTKKAKAHDYER